MPEGDTIFRTARALQKALGGKVVTSFETGLAHLARVHDDAPVVGRTVEKVESRGKWCLIYFSGDLILVTHMLMSGTWHIYRPEEKWWIARSRMRAAITCGDYQAVAFNVPIAEFHTANSLARHSKIQKLGPDILGKNFTHASGLAALRTRAETHPQEELGVMLLNQRVIAGLGNVYKSEVAFAAAVHPFRKIGALTDQEMDAIVQISETYMRSNVMDGSGDGIVTYIGHRRTTRAMKSSDRLWVYGRRGEECRRCGAVIEMRKQGEQVRSTYWCPVCQK